MAQRVQDASKAHYFNTSSQTDDYENVPMKGRLNQDSEEAQIKPVKARIQLAEWRWNQWTRKWAVGRKGRVRSVSSALNFEHVKVTSRCTDPPRVFLLSCSASIFQQFRQYHRITFPPLPSPPFSDLSPFFASSASTLFFSSRYRALLPASFTYFKQVVRTVILP